MLAGLQGSGKTTFAGKLAKYLKSQGHTPVLVACDLQRPNAVTQLTVVAEQAGVQIFAPEPGNGKGNPVAVAKNGVKFAKQKMYDTVIIDTAGRLGVDEELMREARAVRDATDPDEVLFVLDAMIGQDAVITAKAFQDGVDFTGVVLTKLDETSVVGNLLSLLWEKQKPVSFLTDGQSVPQDIHRASKEKLLKPLVGFSPEHLKKALKE
jgi:signal recognition particle subunit SRP54